MFNRNPNRIKRITALNLLKGDVFEMAGAIYRINHVHLMDDRMLIAYGNEFQPEFNDNLMFMHPMAKFNVLINQK